ncbi:MAG: hypothetical protein KatS3mg054_0454 [Chloroflexus sp.]|nr:MAG: hypothetical protein KatS3mg054_0219 [Chloroflexus sp.]GIV86401.1 MAG: hypothetical protein KatS3mg054_0430 [Chloroflexus sp.]GIV86425.1 MAG: hypothetical protein KatS3mg054_0454 [Chloroflexus sp.]
MTMIKEEAVLDVLLGVEQYVVERLSDADLHTLVQAAAREPRWRR